MTRFFVAPVAMLALAISSSHAQQSEKAPLMAAPIVFFDIAGPDTDNQRNFYREVFGWESDAGGRVNVPVGGPPLSGLLRTDPAEKVIYIGVPDVPAALDKVTTNGGKVSAPRFEVPGVVVLGLFADPAGNHMGLVEMDGDKAKIP